jgi:flagellar basal-body rod modification protein FlgD
MIPPSLIVSAASSALGLISSVASNATSSNTATTGTTNTGTTNTGTTNTGTTTKPKGNDVVNQAEFMKLLIAQLQNQDPLNPLDSANFSAQLAQFSSLEQLTQINQKLGAQSEGKVGRFEAVGFIGREVTGASLGIAVEGGVATTLDYTLTQTGTVQAKIVNSNGQQVADVVLGSQGAGDYTFDLSKIPDAPKLDDGTYAVVVTQANPAGGAATPVDTYVTGRVTGVDLTHDTPVLLLGRRRLVLADVTEIKEIAADTAA